MATCATCGKVYHYCGSCSPSLHLDEGYCSRVCMQESPVYIDELRRMREFIISLNAEQLGYFRCLIEDTSEGLYRDLAYQVFEEPEAPNESK